MLRAEQWSLPSRSKGGRNMKRHIARKTAVRPAKRARHPKRKLATKHGQHAQLTNYLLEEHPEL
jgi:hypothetical protein